MLASYTTAHKLDGVRNAKPYILSKNTADSDLYRKN